MKKSFMTRVLATGLSLAMAFSLTAATNVSVASAAAKPAMKSSKMTVKVGESKNYQAKKETQKAFKITKVKMSAAGQTKAKVTVNSSKKSIKVEGLAPTKSSNVVIYFKNNKTKKTTKVTTKVVVKEVKEEKAIKSATQTGVKTIAVTTNFDATNSTVKITRNGAAVETDKIGFSEDGKTITILTVANVVEAEYTITVDDLTKTLTGETSKVDKIEILSDKAAAKKVSGKYTQATVGYAVYNQFGDDITKTTSLTANTSAAGATLSAKDHLVTFTAPAGQEFMIGRDIITLVLLDSGNTGVSAQATLTVDMEAYGKDMTFEGVYNTDNKTLTEDTDFSKDTFYALFTVKDQYGMKLKSYKGVTENDDLYLSVLGGLTTLDRVRANGINLSFTVITKEGTDYLAFPLTWTGSMTPVAGEATVQLLSKGGASCQGTITVAEGDRVADITFTNPAVLAAREVTEIPFSATDASGKEVTKFKTLNKIKITQPTNGASMKFEKQNDGTAKLYLDATGVTNLDNQNATSVTTVTFETQSKKFFHHMFTITETARPVAIDGIQGISTTIANSTNPIEIKLKNLKLEDQYGRVMSESDIKRVVKNANRTDGKATPAKYKIGYVKVEILHETYNTGIMKMTNATSTGAEVYREVVSFADQDTVIAKIQPNTNAKGDVTLEFTFRNGIADEKDKDYVKDSADVMFTVKDVSQVDEATVSVDTIYCAADGASSDIKKAYKKAVKVVANGAQLGVNEYEVDAPACFKVVKGDNVWEIYFNDQRTSVKEFKDKTADTITKQITVTLNGTGEKVTQDVTVSRVAPYTASIALKDDQETVYVAADTAIDNAAVLAQALKEVKDQYGVKLELNTISDAKFADGTSAKPVYTFTSMDDNDTITNNGSIDAKLTIKSTSLEKSAIMAVTFGENSTATTKIKLKVAGSGNTAVATAVNAWKDAVATSAGGVKLVQVIDKYQELNGGSKWSSLKNVDKQALVDEIWANGASVASGSAAGINEVVVKYSADAYVARKAISDTKIDSKDIATALKDGKVVSTSGITVTNVVTASAITGKAIGLSCVTISAIAPGTNVKVEATPSAVDNDKNGYVDVTYQYVVSGSAVTVVDRYKVAIVGDAYTAPSVSVSYWDYSIKNNAFIRE